MADNGNKRLFTLRENATTFLCLRLSLFFYSNKGNGKRSRIKEYN